MDFKFDPKYFDLIITYGPKIITAIVILIVGLWLIRKLTEGAAKGMERSGIDPDLRPFLASMVNVMMKIFLVLSVANIVGIQTTSIVAVIASAAFAVGLALQGTLSNFAAGIMILIFKPYRVGDQVEMAAVFGKVREIQIFNTIICTPQNKLIIVPNSNAINGIIGNYTTNKTVKTNIQIPVRYNQDFATVRNIILQVLNNTPELIKNDAPDINIERFEQDGFLVNIGASLNAEDLDETSGELKKQLYTALTEGGIKLGLRKNKEK